LDNETPQIQHADESNFIKGKAPIVRAVYAALYEKTDISSLRDILFGFISPDHSEAAALMDTSFVLQAAGDAEGAARNQQAALEISRIFTIRNGRGTGPTVLVFVTAGDFMANTPIEYLLEESDTNILFYYVDGQTKALNDIPEHDVAFVAVAESPLNQPVLENLDRLLSRCPGPIINGSPARINALSRDGVAETFKSESAILAPTTVRVSREQLKRLASGEVEVQSFGDIDSLPVIIRPIGTHAGKGMEKISAWLELSTYLNSWPEDEFYIAPFIDYSGSDGKFRKQRIAFIDGRAFASHLAISDHWMVHYLSAGMAEHVDRRTEEETWMVNFDADFAVRHSGAFDALHRRLGLDYFAIDCAELPDGRLLLFEADVAMIVHSMDSEAIFPYKKPVMTKLYSAFESALKQRAGWSDAAPAVDDT